MEHAFVRLGGDGEPEAGRSSRGARWAAALLAAALLAIAGRAAAPRGLEQRGGQGLRLEHEVEAGLPAFQPPTIPLIMLDPFFQVHMMAEKATDDVTRGWYSNMREMQGMIRVDGTSYRFLGACTVNAGQDCPAPMDQVSVDIGTIRTDFVFRDPEGRIELRVTYMSTPYTDDEERFARPVAYVVHDVESLDGKGHEVQLYFDASAEHATFSADDVVEWDGWEQNGLKGIRVGTVAQQFLHRHGDKMNLDWGFLHIAASPSPVDDEHKDAEGTHQPLTIVRGGGALDNRADFISSGHVSRTPDQGNPRACGEDSEEDKTIISVSQDMQTVTSSKRHVVLVAYDDVYSVKYYGSKLMGYWRKQYSSIQEAMAAAAQETNAMLARAAAHDKAEVAALTEAGGAEYAAVTRVAYRQSMAALKLVWNEDLETTWMFLKEISTNGDMNTVDVVYPASPVLIYHNPLFLQKLLVPMLSFANNETSENYWKPFSPHELGVYPVADHGTRVQEPMPMENTGNMFFMILAIMQRSDDFGWVEGYYPMLESWATYLNSTLPFPEHQLCTDDFRGPLANNTNLAAKGIVALEAFAEMCRLMDRPGCKAFSDAARAHAKVWAALAREDVPMPHTRLAYGDEGSFSIVYNLLWQRLLRLGDKPFANYDDIADEEVAFYLSIANDYGTPLDSRDHRVKTDWLSWAAAMANDTDDFKRLFHGIFRFFNESTVRVPMSDFYNTITAGPSLHDFRDRPVIGALYAKALLHNMESEI